MTTDEQIIKEALQDYLEVVSKGSDHPIFAEGATAAIAALDRINSRCIPELPAGWRMRLTNWEETDTGDSGWGVELFSLNGDRIVDEGETPRAACEAAIARI